MIIGQLTCRCPYPECDGGYVSKRLVIALTELQELIPGYDIHINSGYRCIRWNTHWRGWSLSKHMSGEAVDFTVPGLTVPEIVLVTMEVPYFRNGGIGAYLGETERVHGDVRREHKARWLYVNEKKQSYKQLVQSGIFTTGG